MKSSDRRLSRRSFLIGLGAGASATAALASGERKRDAGGAAKEGTKKGYRLTDHVRNYYRSAKV